MSDDEQYQRARVEAVATALARESYPLATELVPPTENERIAARKFLAMFDAASSLPAPPHPPT